MTLFRMNKNIKFVLSFDLSRGYKEGIPFVFLLKERQTFPRPDPV
jgi:hypothetical protein